MKKRGRDCRFGVVSMGAAAVVKIQEREWVQLLFSREWEFQVGPSVGISAADELWVSRYILERITEISGMVVSFDPMPIPGDWNGVGAHTNYSYLTRLCILNGLAIQFRRLLMHLGVNGEYCQKLQFRRLLMQLGVNGEYCQKLQGEVIWANNQFGME